MADNEDVKYVAQGGLNYDDNLQVFPPQDYRYALNCISNESGEFGVVTNIKGNQLVTFVLPAGVNTVIGGCEDREIQAYIYFVYNNHNDHCIVRYKGVVNTVQYILYSQDVLNFRIEYRWRINNPFVVGEGSEKLLFWTDNFNPPRKLNVIQAIEFTRYDLYGTTSTSTTSTSTTSTSSTSTSSTSTTSTSSTSTSSTSSTSTSSTSTSSTSSTSTTSTSTFTTVTHDYDYRD